MHTWTYMNIASIENIWKVIALEMCIANLKGCQF
jgi:hypothetical protein